MQSIMAIFNVRNIYLTKAKEHNIIQRRYGLLVPRQRTLLIFDISAKVLMFNTILKLYSINAVLITDVSSFQQIMQSYIDYVPTIDIKNFSIGLLPTRRFPERVGF